MNPAYCYAPDLEGLASMIREGIIPSLVPPHNFQHSVRFPDGTVTFVYRNDLVITVSFNKHSNIPTSQSESDESETLEHPEESDKEEWTVTKSKKRKVSDYLFYSHASDCGYETEPKELKNITWEELLVYASRETWSFAMSKGVIYDFENGRFLGDEKFAKHRNWIQKGDFFCFKNKSTWHTWELKSRFSYFHEVYDAIRQSKWSWSHIYDAQSGKIFDFRRIGTNLPSCRRSELASADYVLRFDIFYLNAVSLSSRLTCVLKDVNDYEVYSNDLDEISEIDSSSKSVDNENDEDQTTESHPHAQSESQEHSQETTSHLSELTQEQLQLESGPHFDQDE